MTVWHISDLHIGHRRVAIDRWERLTGLQHPGGADEGVIEWHDNMLAYNWDSTIRPGDKVYVQGDLSLQGKNAIEGGLAWIAARREATQPENIIFIPGNHDGCHTGIERSTSFKWFKRYMEFFEMVTPYARIRINGEVVHLSHLPYGSKVIVPTWEPDEWREVLRHPGYAAHPDGFIRGRFGRVLKHYVMPKGYHQIAISNGAEGVVKRYVHQLVCEAFHGVPSDPLLEVAHCNGHRWDNRAVNLRWATHEENMQDQLVHGTRRGGSLPGESNPSAKLSAEDVAYIRSSADTGLALAKQFDIASSHVSRIRLGQSWVQNPNLDHTVEARYNQWRLPDMGDWLLHGHTHSTQKIIPGTKMIHIGVDANDYTPISHEEIAEIMKAHSDNAEPPRPPVLPGQS